MRVLIADASIIYRQRLMHELLADLDDVEIVGQAKDAEEIHSMVSRRQPDVVIFDVLMPKGSGVELLAEIKKLRPSAKTIVLTNYADQKTRGRCLDIGADYYFDKSTELAKVIAALRDMPAAAESSKFRSPLR